MNDQLLILRQMKNFEINVNFNHISASCSCAAHSLIARVYISLLRASIYASLLHNYFLSYSVAVLCSI